MSVLSWEKIRDEGTKRLRKMVLQEQDKLGQHDNMFRLEAIAKAQAKITMRRIYNWGLEGCPHVQQSSLKYTQKRECGRCWLEMGESLR